MRKIILTILLVFVCNIAYAITPVTRTEISHAIDSTWTAVDVTVYVDAGNTAGIILEMEETSGTERTVGVRKTGSTDTLTGGLEDDSHTYYYVGVDSNDQFDLYISDASVVDVYIVAYILDSEGTFFTNPIADNKKSLSSINTWENIDISGDTGGDTAVVAFFIVDNESAVTYSWDWGLREDGSTDNLVEVIYPADMVGAAMSCNNEIVEGNVASNANVHFYLMGYLNDTSTFTSYADSKDYSATTTNLEDVDFSSDIPSGNDGAFVHLYSSDGTEYWQYVRKKGDGYVPSGTGDISEHAYGWVALDDDRKAEQRVENTAQDLYLWGYTSSGAPAVTSKVIFLGDD